jgi:Protein of unknown function (DUF3179)
MAGVSAVKFWLGLAGLVALLVAGQVIWAILAWNSAESGGVPIIVPDSPDPGPIWSRRKIYDAFPPLVRFEVDSAEDAGSSILDGESILGVEVGDEARAYPLNMMGHPGSEVVNDTLGGRPIAVTFCGLCETPLVFSRRVDEKVLTFYVSGVLVESNMLIKDTETRSGWVQLLGRAVDGPLKGKELERLPSTWTDWKTWRAEHPRTTAIRLVRGTKKYSPATNAAADSRRQAFIDALQWGLAVKGKARSWPFSGLAKERVVNDSFDGKPLLVLFDPEKPSPTGFDRRLDDKELTFRRRGEDLVDESTGSTWDPSTGRAIRGPLEGRRLLPVSGTIAATVIWRAFHPDSETWAPVEPSRELTPKGR